MTPALSRQGHYRLMHRIYAVLNSGEWRLRYRRIRNDERFCRGHGIAGDTVGLVDDENDVIYVDHRFDVLATIVHECLHVIFPDAAEPTIRGLERAIMRRMSPLQAKRLHLVAGAALEE